MLSTIEEEEFEKSAKIVASYLSYIIRRSFPRSFNSNKNVCCLFFRLIKEHCLITWVSLYWLTVGHTNSNWNTVIQLWFGARQKRWFSKDGREKKNSQCTISVESDYFLSLDGLTLSTAQIFFSFNLGFNIFQPELWINFVLFTNLSE